MRRTALVAWLVGCGGGPAAGPQAPVLDPALEAERVALHGAERALLIAQADAALAAGELARAGLALVSLEPIGGDPDRARALLARAEAGDPGLAAQLHDAFSQAVRDPERSGWHAGEVVRLERAAGIRAAYGSEGLAGTRAAVRGVSIGLLEPALRDVATAHVAPPDPEALARAGAARLDAVLDDPVVRAAFPAIGAPAPAAPVAVAELGDAAEAGRAAVRAAVAAGFPEDLAVAEWVAGVCAAMDRWTRVVWPAEIGGWEAHHSGITVGVGLEVEPTAAGLVVTLPIPDGPAWTAGIHQGDLVVGVGEGSARRTAAEGPDALAAALVGPPDSTVAITVVRDGAERTFAVARGPIREPTALGWTRGPDNRQDPAIPGAPGVAYARIPAFRPYTAEELSALLFAGDPPRAVILDLRGNGGGDLQAAAELVDLFRADGIVASLVGPGAPPPPAEGELGWNALVPGGPGEAVHVAVLIDRDTASAAEVAAGSLGERDGVVLIGERTFGKGWSQGLRADEAHGFAYQVTNVAWTLPDGRGVQRLPGATDWGVPPDLPIVASTAEAWQLRARRAALEFPRSHADGTPMIPPDPGLRDDLPALSVDPAVALALAYVSAPPHDEPAPAVQP